MAAVHGTPTAPHIDWSLRQLGFCGVIDDDEWRRCYRRAGHSGACTFSDVFQLRHPRLDPVIAPEPRRR